MRIIGGAMRGLRLATVGAGDKSAHLRPTPDRVRESLFSILVSLSEPIDGAIVLDLFAGTGALGLEALSRGAAHVTFVENGRIGAGLIKENIAKAKAEGVTRLIRGDAARLPRAGEPANLIFLDPPYGKNLGERALASACDRNWIAPDALVVWEESAPQLAPSGMSVVDNRRYGDTHLTLMRAT